MDNKFIKTYDNNVALNLRRLGYVELPKEGSFFVFINKDEDKKKQNFEKENVVYTNRLCF